MSTNSGELLNIRLNKNTSHRSLFIHAKGHGEANIRFFENFLWKRVRKTREVLYLFGSVEKHEEKDGGARLGRNIGGNRRTKLG
jgi:hypothetical protein